MKEIKAYCWKEPSPLKNGGDDEFLLKIIPRKDKSPLIFSYHKRHFSSLQANRFVIDVERIMGERFIFRYPHERSYHKHLVKIQKEEAKLTK